MLPVLRRSNALGSGGDWMEREMNRLMWPLWGDGRFGDGGLSYPADIWEDDESVHVEAELPGFAKDDIEVTLENGMLQISAERSSETEQRKGSPILNERRYAKYYRSFALPAAVGDEDVDATFNNGVLHLTLPKRPEARPRRINLK